MRRARNAAVACALAGLLVGGAARAVTCPAIDGGSPALTAIDAGERLESIRSHLVREARRAHIWSWTWLSIYATLSVGSLAIDVARGPDTRIDGYINSGSAAIGVISIVAMPLKVMGDARRLDRLLGARHATASPEETCALVAEAERLLVRDARGEAFGR